MKSFQLFIIEGIVHDIDGIVEIVVWTNDRILFKTRKNLRSIYVVFIILIKYKFKIRKASIMYLVT